MGLSAAQAVLLLVGVLAVAHTASAAAYVTVDRGQPEPGQKCVRAAASFVVGLILVHL